MNGVMHAPVHDRVRANTWPLLNERVDAEAQLRLREAAESLSSDEFTRPSTELHDGLDFHRTAGTGASVMGLVGRALGLAVDQRPPAGPGVGATMLPPHATHGWYPLLPVFRRIGVRTQDEI